MPDVPLDEARVAFLLELLRKRTQAEVTLGVMGLAPSFTAELRRALELFQMEKAVPARKVAGRSRSKKRRAARR